MVILIAPNGVVIKAADSDVPRMLKAGYVHFEQPKPAPKRRTTTRKAKTSN